MSLVKFQVERRPISPDGKVFRGLKPLDYISVPSHAKTVLEGDAVSGTGTLNFGVGVTYVPVGEDVPTPTQVVKSHMVELVGEPWLVVSTHFSIESALAAAAPVAGAIGADNVRIVQVLSHSTQFKLQ